MKSIYGVPVITCDDLFSTAVRPSYITDFVSRYIEDIDTDLGGDMIPLGKFFKSDFVSLWVDFVPLDIVEYYIMYKSKLENDINNNIDKRTVLLNAESTLENFLDNRDNTFKDNKLHLAIIREAKQGHYLDACLCVPRVVISKLKSPTIYTCKRCGYTEAKTNDLPDDMLYTIEDNKVVYYCKECLSGKSNIVHVGDSLLNPSKKY